MLRAQLRDWFAMTVLANWLNRAKPEQIVALGTDLVRRGVCLQQGYEGPTSAEVVVYANDDQHVLVDGQSVPLTQGEWGPA